MAKNIKLKEGEVKIGSKDEKFWSDVLDTTNKDIEAHENLLKLQKAIKEMCEKKIKELDK